MYERPNPFIDWESAFTFCLKGVKSQLKQVIIDKRMYEFSNVDSFRSMAELV